MPQEAEWKVLLVAVTGSFMVILSQTIMNVALPHIMTVFSVTADHAQLVISAYMMATAIITPAAAFLCDRFGTKKIYLISQLAFLVGSILCGISWDANSLIAFRMLQGFGGGLLTPITMTFLFNNVPPEDRGRAMAIFGIPMMLGPAIGPTLGGYLVDYWSWRLCFYVNIPMILLAIYLGIIWLEETPATPAGFDFKGFVSAAIGFSAILFALSYAPTWGWDDLRIIGLLSAGSLSLIIWIIIELRVKLPMLDLRLFEIGGFSLSIGLTFITTIGLFSAVFLIPLFLQNLRGLSAMHAGMMMIPSVLGSVVTMPISGRLYDRIGPRIPSIIGLIIMFFSTLSLNTVDVTTPDMQLAWLLFVRGLGMGFAMMPIMTYGLSAVPPKMTTQASSLLNVWRSVFASLGIAIFATLLDHFQKTNYAVMAQTLTPDSIEAMRILSMAQVAGMQTGLSLEAARQAGIYLIYQFIMLKASVTAFQMDYTISAILIFISIFTAFLLPSRHFKQRQPGENSNPVPV